MEGKIVVRLADGDRIAIPDAEAMLAYDELWLGAMDVIGAVSTAGMIEYARRRARRGLAQEVALSERQSGVFREALAQIRSP